MNGHLSQHRLLRGLSKSLPIFQDVQRGHNDADAGNEYSASLDASDDAKHAVSGVFQQPEMRRVNVRQVVSVEHFQYLHDFPRSKARNHQTATGRSAILNSAYLEQKYFALSVGNRNCEIHRSLTAARRA